jgi:hypothetical protein
LGVGAGRLPVPSFSSSSSDPRAVAWVCEPGIGNTSPLVPIGRLVGEKHRLGGEGPGLCKLWLFYHQKDVFPEAGKEHNK